MRISNRLLLSWNKKRDTNSLVRMPNLVFNLHRRDVGRATWVLSDDSQGGEEWLHDRRRYACQNASKGVSFAVNLDEIGYRVKATHRQILQSHLSIGHFAVTGA